MRRVWTVAARELRSYFDHATAYILVVAFLSLALFLAFRALLASGAASLRPLFVLLPWYFVVFMPAITMRSLAEERRTGTLDWLMAQPLSEIQVLGGKFVGDWLFALIALAGTVPTALGVLLLSSADPGIMVAQYVGAAMLAAQMVAAGLFASSFTRNQITAFILGGAICLTLVLIGLEVVLVGLPPVAASVFARLSVITHFENVARGVIDVRDVLYFASTAFLFLALAHARVSGERLSVFRGGYRRLRLGATTIVVGVVVLNLLAASLRGRVDLTEGNLYTLSPGIREVLSDLDDLVTVKLYVSRELPPEINITLRDVRDLLADFRNAADGRLALVEVDPDRDEEAAEEARSFGINALQFNVMRNDELQVRRGWLGLAVLYADQSEVMPVLNRTDDLEYRLASAIAGMTTDRKTRIVFISGAGARDSFQYPVLSELLGDRYELTSRDLSDSTASPLATDAPDVLVVAGPQEEMNSAAVTAIRDYLHAGGAGLFLIDGNTISPQMPIAQALRTGLEPLAEEYGVRVAEGLVFDLRSNERVSLGTTGGFTYISSYPLWPRVVPAPGEHPMTTGLDALSLAWASPLEIADSTLARPLWMTTELAGRRPGMSSIAPDAEYPSDRSELSPQVVAAVGVGAGLAAAAAGGDGGAGGASADTLRRGRLVVVGDADFLDNEFVRANSQNAVFVANAIDWLAQDESLIKIRAKDRTPPPLLIESDVQRIFFKWGNLIGVPLLFVGFGVARAVQRRRDAELRGEGLEGR
ncbi:MAG: Gldg family protein [Gemmatimonadetes bacterium]|nr:Gldg family protein [Gemmatimonadota bacterium]